MAMAQPGDAQLAAPWGPSEIMGHLDGMLHQISEVAGARSPANRTEHALSDPRLRFPSSGSSSAPEWAQEFKDQLVGSVRKELQSSMQELQGWLSKRLVEMERHDGMRTVPGSNDAVQYLNGSSSPSEGPAAAGGNAGNVSRPSARGKLKQGDSRVLSEAATEQYLRDDEQFQADVREMATQVRLTRRERLHDFAQRHCPSIIFPQRQYSKSMRVVGSRKFDGLVLVAIMIDAALTGVFVDSQIWSWHLRLGGQPADNYVKFGRSIWTVLDVCTVLFLLELLLKIVALRGEFVLGVNWVSNFFDTIVVMCSIPSLLGVQSIGASIVRSLRILRVFKTARLMYSLNLFPDLRLMMNSIYRAAPLVGWALVMMMSITYVFSIFLLAMFEAHFDDDPGWTAKERLVQDIMRLYGRLDRSMWTLFYVVSGGVDWRDAVRPLEDFSLVFTLIFALYVFGTLFGILSVLVGLFCERALNIGDLDPKLLIATSRESQEELIREMTQVFKRIDKNGAGEISWEQFREYISTFDHQAYFKAMGLNLLDGRALFQLLDEFDGTPSGTMDLSSFLLGMLRVTGDAKATDLVTLLHESRKTNRVLIAMVHDIQASVCQPGADAQPEDNGPMVPTERRRAEV